jgi:hypothetical protein
MLLTFLSASVPLTKTITKTTVGGVSTITKDSYPLQSKFTSNAIEVDTVARLYEAIKQMSQHPDKPCLLKGGLAQPLNNESRKHSTKTNTTTAWVVKDLDSAPFNTPDEYMKSVGLGDISYVVQYSSSYKLNKKDKTLSCHIFCLLSEPRPAPELKAWLMHLNLTTEVLKQALTLSNSQIALHWPLDITCCQNDKLIYIAEPNFVGMESPVPIGERIQLVKRELDAIPVQRIALRPMDTLKKEQRRILNDLQIAAGLTPTKAKTKMVGEYEVQSGVSEIAQYQIIDCGEYNRIDLNGGDSRAYYHRKDDPTYLHNFKGEPSVLLKEILPQYYADLVRDRSNQDATPLADGQTLLLAYRDKVTADYYKGTWNEATQLLDLHKVKSRDQLQDFLLGHGRALGDFVPEWQTVFNPASAIVVDEVEHILNRFQPSHYMQAANQKKGHFPGIQRLIDSAVGTGDIQAHFLNWLAYMFQFKKKPMTSWVLHGTFGTGKGMLVGKVVAPLFGHEYVHQMRASELNEQFNGWLENSLVVFIDEIDAGMFTNAKSTNSNLKKYITDSPLTIRRMRTDSYMVPNFTGFIFGSNEKQPVYVPMGDRRYNVGSFQAERYFPSDDELDAMPGELKHFAHFLQHYKVSEKAARSVLQTEEREAIQQLGMTSIDQLANDLLEGNLGGMLEALPDTRLMDSMGVVNPTAAAYTAIVRRFCQDATAGDDERPANTVRNTVTRERTPPTSKITRDELAVLFTHCVGKVPEGAHKFTAFLRHHGITTKVLRVDGETPRGLEVTWKITADDRACIVDVFPSKPTKLKAVK